MNKLQRLFVVPPFSVFDTMSAYWRHRKKAWLELGLRSDLGRGDALACTQTLHPYDGQGNKSKSHFAIPGGGGGGAWLKLGKSIESSSKYRAMPGGGPMPIDRKKNSKAMATAFQGQESLWKVGKKRRHAIADKINITAKRYDQTPCYLNTSQEQQLSGTSIFDPVLCEIMYRWFAGENSRVFDPFAGGSVRGVVAALLGHHYTGIDLRKEQVAANCQQWVDVLEKCEQPPSRIPDNVCEPYWYVNDAVKVMKTTKANWADFILTCPPYTFLEQYSDDPLDLSTMNYDDFLKRYRYVIRRCVRLLRPDRFACFVVGEVRDPKNHGIYVNFVGDTITAFLDAGMGLYNRAILMTSPGSLPIRAGHQMNASAKIGNRHQDVLIFVKGDPVAAHKAMPFNFKSLSCLVHQSEINMAHTGFGFGSDKKGE